MQSCPLTSSHRRIFGHHPEYGSLRLRGIGLSGGRGRTCANGSTADAIVHKSVEHQPTLIKDGTNPPYVTNKGVPTLNTFLVFVPSITVPSGFTSDHLPV